MIWPWQKNTDEAKAVLTKEEAIRRARAHAESEGGPFDEPYEVYLERRTEEVPQGKEQIPIYVITSAARIPVSVIEVDAVSGEILKWKTFPR